MKRAIVSAPVTFTVTVNHSPVAVPDAASTLEDTAVTIPVLANDTDSDGDTLTLASVGTPAHGTTAIVGGGVVYTPAADFYGTDTFTVRRRGRPWRIGHRHRHREREPARALCCAQPRSDVDARRIDRGDGRRRCD